MSKHLIFSLIYIFAFTGCFGISDEVKNKTSSAIKKYNIKNQEFSSKIKKESSSVFFKTHIKDIKELKKVNSIINSNLRKLDLCDDTLSSFIAKDESSSENLILNQIMNCNKLIKTIDYNFINLSKVQSKIKGLISNKSVYENNSIKKLSKLKEILSKTENHNKLYQEKYDFNKESIDKKISFYTKDISNNIEKINLDVFKTDNLNNIVNVTTNLEKFLRKAIKAEKEVNDLRKELDSYRVKILKDIEVKTFLYAEISSWDEYSDWDFESTKVIKREVPEEMVEKVEINNVNHIANYPGGGLFSRSTYDCMTSKDICNQFKDVFNRKQFASRGDTDAQLWVYDTEYKYNATYTIIENGIKKELTEKMTESDYNKYSDFVNHEIYSKPLGYFKDEVITTPNPVGMSLVGNKNYGNWEKDPSTGTSFWVFYGQYRLLTDVISAFSGNSRYDRGYYNTWNNNYRNRKYDRRYGYSGTGYNKGSYKNTYAGSGKSYHKKLETGNTKRSSSSFRQNSSLKSSGASSRGRGTGKGK